MKLFILLKDMWFYLKQDKIKIIFLTILLTLKGVVSLAYGYLFGLAVDSLIQNDFNKFVLIYVFYSLYAFLHIIFINFVGNNLYSKIEINFMKRISKDLYKKALDLPVKAYDKHAVGEIVNRIYTDPQKVIQILRELLSSFSRVLMVIFIFIISINVSLIVTIQFLIAFLLNYILSTKYYPRLKKIEEEVSGLGDKYVSNATQVLTGIRDVKGLGLKIRIAKMMNINIDDLFEKKLNSRKTSIFYETFVETIQNFLEALIFITLGYLVVTGNVVMPIFIAFQWYVWNMFNASNYIVKLGADYQKVIVALSRLNDILFNKLYEDEQFGSKKIDQIKGNIEFKDVSFGYENGNTVLKKINMDIKTGQKIAIVGKSGIGKSTIFNLLMRYYDFNKGKILIDGINIKKFDQESLRNHIAIIRQEPYIFNKTIKENFELIKENITIEEIRDLCKKVYIDDYIMSLNHKYDTLIGEGGINLSGGQKQRLAIARSLAKDSKIILFDESTSSLDNESQQIIKTAIDELASNHTIIMIAHRLSTIIDADVIYLIDKGKVIASGTHKTLLKESELYQKLYKPEMLELNI